MKTNASKLIFLILIITALSGLITSPVALVLGFIFTIIFTNPFNAESKKAIKLLLKVAIIGLGFGMYVKETLVTSKESFVITLLSILLTVSMGILLTKLLKIDRKIGHLVTSGTAICGGSAIAAISAVIKANSKAISIALGIVFLLNSVALLIFPPIGHYLNLTQAQFGLWAAIAIHDTSSVVGAALAYGDEALKVATTVKLARTLWIIPLSIFSMFLFKTKGEKITIPYFIVLFILAIVINSTHIIPSEISSFIVLGSKRLLLVTLFLVGSTISIADIKSTGLKPLGLGLSLWVIISIFSLSYILFVQ